MIAGAFAGFTLNYIRQSIQIIEGAKSGEGVKTSIDGGELLQQTAIGALMAPIGAIIAAEAPIAATLLTIAGAVSGGVSAYQQWQAGNKWTAAFDAFTGIISLGGLKPRKGGGGGSSASGGALALVESVTLPMAITAGSAALAGQSIQNLTVPFFTAITGGNNGDNSSPGGDNSQDIDPPTPTKGSLFRGDKKYKKGKFIGHEIGSDDWKNATIQTPWEHVNRTTSSKDPSSTLSRFTSF
jgi:hypothetical protein